MKLILDLKKAKSERGKEKGGTYLRRVATGKKDKDGSPTYRYLRTQEEVAAYERNHKKDTDEDDEKKVTHEDQKAHHEDIKEKTDKKKPSLLVKKKKMEKSIYVRI